MEVKEQMLEAAKLLSSAAAALSAVAEVGGNAIADINSGEIERKLSEQIEELDSRLETAESEIDKVDGKCDDYECRIDDLESTVNDIDVHVLEKRIEALEEFRGQENLSSRITRLESVLKALTAALTQD